MILLFDWKCPHCTKHFYSSSAERDVEFIDCCYCSKKLENPHFVKKKDAETDEKTLR